MFNFANFYQLIAQDTRLQPWLNVLPQQLTDWQNAEHGDFGRWLKALNKIPQGAPNQVDIKNSVTISNDTPFHEGELKKLESLLRTFHPWRKDHTQCTVFISILNGAVTGNGIAFFRTSHH